MADVAFVAWGDGPNPTAFANSQAFARWAQAQSLNYCDAWRADTWTREMRHCTLCRQGTMWVIEGGGATETFRADASDDPSVHAVVDYMEEHVASEVCSVERITPDAWPPVTLTNLDPEDAHWPCGYLPPDDDLLNPGTELPAHWVLSYCPERIVACTAALDEEEQAMFLSSIGIRTSLSVMMDFDGRPQPERERAIDDAIHDTFGAGFGGVVNRVRLAALDASDRS